MESVFNFILAFLSDFRELAINFKIEAFGFSFTLWHFWIALIVIGLFIPFFFKITSNSPFLDTAGSVGLSVGSRVSERVVENAERQKMEDDYYYRLGVERLNSPHKWEEF